jgi:hypothetical protein
MGKRNFTKTSSISIATLFIYLLQTLFIISNYNTHGKSGNTDRGKVLETHSEHLPHKLLTILVVLLSLDDGTLRSDGEFSIILGFTDPNNCVCVTTMTRFGTNNLIFLCLEILVLEEIVASLTNLVDTEAVTDHGAFVSFFNMLLMHEREILLGFYECRFDIFVMRIVDRILYILPALLEGHLKLLQIKEIKHMELELQRVSLESAGKFLKVEVRVKGFTINVLTRFKTLTKNLGPRDNLPSS